MYLHMMGPGTAEYVLVIKVVGTDALLRWRDKVWRDMGGEYDGIPIVVRRELFYSTPGRVPPCAIV